MRLDLLPVRSIGLTVLLGIVLGSIGLAEDQPAAEPPAAKPPTATFQTLPETPMLLKRPKGVSGKFKLAKTAPRIEFAILPGQSEGARLWSSWGEALTSRDGKFYVSIGDHGAPHGAAFVHAIDSAAQTVTQVVDYNAVIQTPAEKYSPGKIHGALVEDAGGGILFFGYRGSAKQTTAEVDYQGDWLLRYDPATGQTENLGIPVPFSSVPVLHYRAEGNQLYGIAVPGEAMPEPRTQFFQYDLERRELLFCGGPESQAARAMMVASDGRVYYDIPGPDEAGGRLVRYDPATQETEQLNIKLPGGSLRAASSPNAQGKIFAIARTGRVFEFDPRSETITDLADAFVNGPHYIATCRLDPTGRYLYYVPGAHGKSSTYGTPVLQLDLQTRQRKVLAFLQEPVAEAFQYHLGGTYGIALSADGSTLLINWNGSAIPVGKQPDFGLCSVMLLHIPESERAVSDKAASTP